MSEPESWDEWNQRRRIEQEQWQREQERFNQPIHPKSDWPPPSNPYDYRITFDPPSDEGGYERPWATREPVDLAGCVSGLVFIPALAAWPVLYPVPTLLGFAVAAFSYGIAETRLPLVQSGPKLAIGLLCCLVGLIVAIAAGRWDHRLARSWAWRGPRHVLRVALFTFLAHLFAATELWPARPASDPVPGLELLANPLYLAGLAGVVVVVHLILTREKLKKWWHERLETVKLRPSPYPEPP